MTDQFNAQAARSHRPLPLWVDAFQRDTQHLSGDEIGVYIMLLMAMWSRESCDLPDDDGRLALIARVTPTVWKRRYSRLMRGFFHVSEGIFLSKRLQKEAKIVEQFCAAQAGRRKVEISEKSKENQQKSKTTDQPRINRGSTTDASTVQPTYNLQPTRKEEEDARAREANSDFEKDSPPAVSTGLLDDIRSAVGVQPHEGGVYWSDTTLTAHVRIWLGFGLTAEQVLAEAKSSRVKNPNAPDGPKALDRWMETAAKARRNLPSDKVNGVQRAEKKPPQNPEERLKFFADWVNGTKPLPPSTLSNTLVYSLLEAGLVTVERLKVRGITA